MGVLSCIQSTPLSSVCLVILRVCDTSSASPRTATWSIKRHPVLHSSQAGALCFVRFALFARFATFGDRPLLCSLHPLTKEMDFPPPSLPDLAPAYPPQLELLHTGYYNVLPTQQLYGQYGVDQSSAFTLQVQPSGRPVATTPNHNLHLSTLPTLQPSYVHLGAVLAGNSQPARPASSMGPPARLRKRKAATLRADDWEPYKKRILDLHIKQKRSLSEVREIIEEEYGFKAEYVTSV
jgi:hypothetical protein